MISERPSGSTLAAIYLSRLFAIVALASALSSCNSVMNTAPLVAKGDWGGVDLADRTLAAISFPTAWCISELTPAQPGPGGIQGADFGARAFDRR